MKQKCPKCDSFACVCIKETKPKLPKPSSEEKDKAQQEYSKLEKEYHVHMGMGYDELRKVRIRLDNLEAFLKTA